VSRLVLESATRLALPTDDAGRFCVRLLVPRDRFVAHLSTVPTDLLDESHVDIPLDGRVKPTVLALAGAGSGTPPTLPWPVTLDDAATSVDVTAATDADGVPLPVSSVTIDLINEAGTSLGESTTDGGGRAHFAVAPDRIGPLGRGELRATFAGNAEMGPGAASAPIERRTHVHLQLPTAKNGVLPAAVAGTTFGLRVVAEPQCAKHGCKTVPTGVVEVRAGDAVVGAGTLRAGEARVPILLDVPRATSVALSLRYIADAPWFLTTEDSEVMQPLSEPMPWGKLATALAGVAVLAWFLAMRSPPSRPVTRTQAARSSTPLPAPGVHVVDANPAVPVWRGRVIDAHDGRPVAGAVVTVERGGFDGIHVLARTTADDGGAFTVALAGEWGEPTAGSSAAQNTVRGSSLVAESALHARMRRPSPPFGTVEIALVLRRRALLDRLVAWARKKGGPFEAAPEPTPAQVRGAATADERVAQWAAATERAAFGPDPVDAATQGAVDRLAPADATAGVDAGTGSTAGESQSRPR
jgi:hypothetical protein